MSTEPHARVEGAFIERYTHLSAEARWLYVCLKYRRNNVSGEAWPGYDDLIKLTGYSRSRVARSLKELEAAGVIIRRHRFGASTVYLFAELSISPDSRTNDTPVVQSSISPHSRTNDSSHSQTNDSSIVRTTDTLTKQLEQDNKELNNSIVATSATTRTETAKPASKSSVKKPPAAFMDNPSVVIYREITHLTPNDIQRQLIAERATDCERWRHIVTKWIASGWNKNNVAGMLELYAKPDLKSKLAVEPDGFAGIREAMLDPRYQELPNV